VDRARGGLPPTMTRAFELKGSRDEVRNRPGLTNCHEPGMVTGVRKQPLKLCCPAPIDRTLTGGREVP
jgi:hypothetical protein